MNRRDSQGAPVGAAALPHDTVVIARRGDNPYRSTRTVAYIHNNPGPGLQWRGTDGSHMRDSQIDELLAVPGRCRIVTPETT